MYKLKTYRRVICHDNIEWCKIGRRCQLKTNMRTLALTLAHKNLKNLHFIELLLNKVNNIWAKKKFKGVMFDGTESWCNIWRKTDFWLQKWHEEFSKFSFTRACPEVLKLRLWWYPFIQSRKCMRLKFAGSFVSWQWRMMQNWKRSWLASSKFTWGIWLSLTRVLENVKKLAL